MAANVQHAAGKVKLFGVDLAHGVNLLGIVLQQVAT
jgi:hypothetical protein